MTSARLITVTPYAERLMAYVARVSSDFQGNPTYENLFRYCLFAKKPHWSVFEQADMTVEVNTSRAISAQIIRHRSFCFQEFSQRYAKVRASEGADFYEPIQWRFQDKKNRQGSIADTAGVLGAEFDLIVEEHMAETYLLYEKLLAEGVAKECARMILPMSTKTKIYMKGNCRNWINYLDVRLDPSTQQEHREVAELCRDIFIANFPTVASIYGWESRYERNPPWTTDIFIPDREA